MKVGFAGLGIMGWPMAQQLIRSGHMVSVWTHNRPKLDRFVQENQATAADTPAELAAHCEVVFLCVGNTEMSRRCILGPQGMIHGAADTTILVDCSTISPSASKEMARELAAGNVQLIDAPCTGSKSGAEAGTLPFMVGGPDEIVDRIRPLLLAMGKEIYHCGAQGMGLHAEGPISDPKDLAPAIRRAIAVVKGGDPALVDVLTQPR